LDARAGARLHDYAHSYPGELDVFCLGKTMVTDSGGFDDRGLSFHFPLVVLPPGGVTCSFSLLIILRRLRIPTLYHNLIRERKSLSDGGGITRSVHSRACTEDGRELPRQKSGLRTFAASCLASGTN